MPKRFVTLNDLHTSIKRKINKENAMRLKPYTPSELMDRYYSLLTSSLEALILNGINVKFSNLFTVYALQHRAGEKSRYLRFKTSARLKSQFLNKRKPAVPIELVKCRGEKIKIDNGKVIIVSGGRKNGQSDRES